jgi:hypothetical protein
MAKRQHHSRDRSNVAPSSCLPQLVQLFTLVRKLVRRRFVSPRNFLTGCGVGKTRGHAVTAIPRDSSAAQHNTYV